MREAGRRAARAPGRRHRDGRPDIAGIAYRALIPGISARRCLAPRRRLLRTTTRRRYGRPGNGRYFGDDGLVPTAGHLVVGARHGIERGLQDTAEYCARSGADRAVYRRDDPSAVDHAGIAERAERVAEVLRRQIDAEGRAVIFALA